MHEETSAAATPNLPTWPWILACHSIAPGLAQLFGALADELGVEELVKAPTKHHQQMEDGEELAVPAPNMV
jgi:hypothetical protein